MTPSARYYANEVRHYVYYNWVQHVGIMPQAVCRMSSSSSIVFGYPHYTQDFEYPQKQKSDRAKSGDREDHLQPRLNAQYFSESFQQ